MLLAIPITGIIFMTSGKIMPRVSIFLLSFLLIYPTISLSDELSELEQLLAPFQTIKHIKLNYQEKRYSLFFKQPKFSQGTIEYIKPDHFIKSVETPIQQIFSLDANQMTMTRFDEKTHQPIQKKFSLDDYPQFKQLKALFSGLFQGDTVSLTQFYNYNITHENAKKSLLTLNTKVTDAFIQQQNITQTIEVLFQQSQITSITMIGFGGERTLITLDKVSRND